MSWPELSQSESSDGGRRVYRVRILVWCARARETSLGGAADGWGAAGGEGVKAASLSPRYRGGGGAGGGAVLPSGSPRPTSVLDVDPRTYIVKAPPQEPSGRGGGGTDETASSVKRTKVLETLLILDAIENNCDILRGIPHRVKYNFN